MPHSGLGDTPRILLVRFSSIGDILLTTPLIRALRARHAGARIDALTKARFAPLLSHNPHLDAVVTLGEAESLLSVASRLRPARYTHRLDLHGSLRSRQLRLLLPGHWRGYRKHRLARGYLVLTRRNRYPPGTRPVPERYFEAAAGLDVQPDGAPPEFGLAPEALAVADAYLRTAGLDPARGIVALAPGAAHATKRWPREHWKRLAALLAEGGRPLVVVGGPEDLPLAVDVASGIPGAAVAAGRFGLQGTGALLARAAALISGDTGLMHMATGVGTPVVALFGPTVEAFGFFPYRARALVVQRDLSCRPCSRMGGPVCPLGHHDCLQGIAAETVRASLGTLEQR